MIDHPLTKHQYVCDTVYHPLANALADCQLCGWEVSRHKMSEPTLYQKGPFKPEGPLSSKQIAEIELTVVGPKLKICGVEVHWWLGCAHDKAVKGLADQINAAFAARDSSVETTCAECAENEADAQAANVRADRIAASWADLRAAAVHVEAVMAIVEPRSHKAEYLQALGKLRIAIEGSPEETTGNEG